MDCLNIMASDFKEQFSDKIYNDFLSWMMQPMLVDIFDVLIHYQEELLEMENDKSIKTLFNIK